MTNVVSQEIMRPIELQLASEQKKSFEVESKLAKVARNQFTYNFNKNWLQSKCSSLLGVASLVGCGFSIYKFFFAPIPAIGLVGASFVLNQIWIHTRNREGYALEKALRVENEDKIIHQLSLGANIHQEIWPCGGAGANLIPILKGGPRTVIQWFAEKGYTKVVAYLAILESNNEKRKQIVTHALPHARDVKTAQLLMDLGGNVLECKENIFTYCCLKNNVELASFFVKNGASLNAGIIDYEKWDADMDNRKKQFGFELCGFETPLEKLLTNNFRNPVPVLEAMHIDPVLYQGKNSAEDLYHSLNCAGIRIRREYACNLFERL